MRNAGLRPLSLGTIEVPSGFRLIGKLPRSLAGGAATVFKIQFVGKTVGTWNGSVLIATSDPLQKAIRIPVHGVLSLRDPASFIYRLDHLQLTRAEMAALDLSLITWQGHQSYFKSGEWLLEMADASADLASIVAKVGFGAQLVHTFDSPAAGLIKVNPTATYDELLKAFSSYGTVASLDPNIYMNGTG
jgi:hypothetical protein